MPITLFVGTDKGAFLYRSDDRLSWQMEGPLFPGWKVTAAIKVGETYFVGTASHVYGCGIQRSTDLAEWQQVENGPAYPEGGDASLGQVWRFASDDNSIYAGVSDAGLFRSSDSGNTWQPVPGLNEHSTRGSWNPGAGGLCAHSIIIDRENPRRIYCGISAVGVFRSDDGGESWTPKNEGVPVILEDKEHKDIGYCVHTIVADPHKSDCIYRQDHVGMFKSDDAGDSWQRMENGLPSGFGFPLVVDPKTAALFAVPLQSDEYRYPANGQLAVFRSTDRAASWQAQTKGLPEGNTYSAVLRGAMSVDRLDPCGVYFGSASGEVFASADLGDSWQRLPGTLPRIGCVVAFES